MSKAVLVAVVLLALVAVVHLLRVLFGVAVVIGVVSVPMWVSVLATIGAGAVAIALWLDRRRP
jgi:hypothetical protein